MANLTYRQALNEALSEELERDHTVFLIGEEVGEYGGAFKVSQGLLKKFGPERIIDTPISEAAFTGLAVGAVMYGLRPIVEFMNWSFALVAFDQIINNAGSIRFMSGGQFKFPIVFRGPSGGGTQIGATHSHALENWLANVPTFTVINPAFPADAKGLLKSAIRSNNPVCFFEGERLYGIQGEVPEEKDFLVPIGKAQIVTEGKDVTVLSSGFSTHVVLQALETLSKENISVEIIDLRTIKPYDFDLIASSIQKTNRLVIVEEGKPFAGWGAQIAYDVQQLLFDELDAPIYRVSNLDIPNPYNGKLEQEILPNPLRVIQAVHNVLK
ncbi:pyruvate dehydrogenase [Methylacidiphilum kamchatkense Kam1]|uniref:Pyruvate dehydrogenase n=1 Tax=Methylacidiphilum kamchatkense Kam1 TaxID=1202785 RepID=A0A0C1V3R9_9BACT|nr:alpha-ketoacid dehydrogenase subunit beta [Methylacidiphilum kamchatkense]KIE58340.1 pyruvate dehydrogenase [Methylacidiphilum kamchatkense Kam1]QDQ42254.1 pyruvate dehydrogenase E1 component beta subunit [Methylacidiphilum kamchatkense Kam1]